MLRKLYSGGGVAVAGIIPKSTWIDVACVFTGVWLQQKRQSLNTTKIIRPYTMVPKFLSLMNLRSPNVSFERPLFLSQILPLYDGVSEWSEETLYLVYLPSIKEIIELWRRTGDTMLLQTYVFRVAWPQPQPRWQRIINWIFVIYPVSRAQVVAVASGATLFSSYTDWAEDIIVWPIDLEHTV
jgi:hypothetical protein